MKRILGCLLCITILLGLRLPSAVAEAEDAAFRTAFGIVNAIGVLDEYDEYTLDTDKKVTRAEFADTLAKVLKLDGRESAEMYYYDVSKANFAYSAITALTECGLMNGTGDNLFRPDDVMKNRHAVKVLLYALGYEPQLRYSDMPDSDTGRIAKEIGVSENILPENEMSFRDMVVLLGNALTAPTLQITGYEDGNANYRRDESRTLLSQNYDCHYREKERVLGANGVSVYGDTLRPGYIRIGENEYVASLDDMSDFIGSYVDYIYEGDPEEGDAKLIWIQKNQRYKEEIVEIREKDAFDSSAYELSYSTDAGRQKKIRLSRNVTVIYNGGFVSDVERVLGFPSYEARIVYNQDGNADIVVISDYTDFVIGSVNPEERFVRSKTGGQTISLDPEDYRHYLLLDAVGRESSADRLKADDVLSVYRSLDEDTKEQSIRIVISTARVSGTVSLKGRADDGSDYIVIDSVRYQPAKGADISLCEPGIDVTLYLDANGKIAYVEEGISSLYALYIIDIEKSEDALSGKLIVKAFNQDGKIQSYRAASGVKINDVKYKRITDTDENNLKNMLAGQVAVCRLSGEGEIAELDTPREGGKIKISDPFGNKYYRPVSSKFGKTAVIDDGTVIFGIPQNPQRAEEEDFELRKKGSLGDWRTFYAECYQLRTNADGVEDIVVIKGFNWYSVDDSDTLFVLSEVTTAVNQEGEVVTALKGFEGLSEKEYECVPDFVPDDIAPGDALLLSKNVKKAVIGISERYNADSAMGETTNYLAANRRVVLGYASDIVGDIIKLGYEDSKSVDEVFRIGSTPVVTVDAARPNRPVRAGSITDINTDQTGNPSKVMVQTYQMIQEVIIVYND